MSRPPESGSGEPVPAPTMHDAARLAAERVEREVEPMLQRLIDVPSLNFWDSSARRAEVRKELNDVARDIKLYVTNALIPHYRAASPGGEPPTPRATQEALEALDRLYAELIDLGGTPMSSRTPELDYQTVRAALGSARPPLPPQVAYVIAGRCLSTQHNQEPCDCAPSGLWEPSREPTLEEIVRQTELIISAEFRLPASSDHEIAALVDLVRARLSSPEAPR